MNIKSYKEQLLKSVMFNLSLSSKELFHSNFLEYLINNDNNVLNYLFDGFIEINWQDKVIVEREKYNFDLLIHDKQNCVIIENKVKSIPNIAQLIEYQKKAENKFKNLNKGFILLTIYEPYKLNSEKKGDWIVLNYLEMLKRLKKYSTVIENRYFKDIILDYINFMDTLINLFQELKMNEEQSIYIDEDILKDLKELRIHDLFYKSRFEILKADLAKRINSEYRNKYKVIEANKWQSLNMDEIAVDNNFTRGTGLFELKVPVNTLNKNEKSIIGVQLQDHSFKLLVQSTNKNTIMAIAEKLNSNNNWFDFSIINKDCVVTNKQTKDYCSYNSKDGLMLYKYKIIEDVSEITIINIFMKYLKYIVNNKDILMKAFLEF